MTTDNNLADRHLDPEVVRRAVVQKLEALSRSGVTHWKRIAPAPVVAPQLTSSARTASSVQAGPTPSLLTRQETGSSMPKSSQTKPSTTATAQKPPAPAMEKSVTPASCAAFQPLNLPRAERDSRLTVLKERVAACVRCQELATTRKQTVFGVGNPEAKILFVGEAPGADEDAQGEPFVGRAGQLLNDIIKACRLKREDIYICNVLRCRPPGNRLPSEEEAGNCREFLDGQIAIVNPDYIVCWGSTAAKNLLASEESIGKMRRKFFTYGRAKVLCTYHPSYLLRNPAAKKDVWEDMKLLFMDMGIDLTQKP